MRFILSEVCSLGGGVGGRQAVHELANKVLVGEFYTNTILFEIQTTIPHRYLGR